MAVDHFQATKTAEGTGLGTGASTSASESLPDGVLGLGRYEVVSVLGKGSFGVVCEVLDTQLQRRVALKVLPGRDAAAEGDLLREARAIAKLAHPNVVMVHEVGTTEDGRLFVTMELVQGETLKEWGARSHSIKEVLSTYIQAGRGLAAIHGAKLVHGDFKPANVLVGDDGRVRVADFGLARLHDPTRTISTGGGAGPRPEGVGTPAYMAPEQHRGEPADARSDQFAFCVALFQAIYGWHPFPALTYADLVERVLNGRVRVPARQGSVGSWSERRVPSWLAHALQRGLEVDPQRRWPSMDALVTELGRDRGRVWRRVTAAIGMAGFLAAGYLGGGRARDAPPEFCGASANDVRQVWTPQSRDRVRSALLGTGVSYAEETWTRVETQLDQYMSDWDQARDLACSELVEGGTRPLFEYRERCLVLRLTEASSLVDVLAKADGAVVEHAAEAASALRPPSSCLERGGADLELDPPTADQIEAVERVRRSLSRVAALRRSGRVNPGLDEVRLLMEDARELDYPPLSAEVRLEYAKLLNHAGKFTEGVAQSKATTFLARGTRHYGVAADAAAVTLAMLSDLGRYDDALRWRDEAAQAVSRVGEDSIYYAYLQNNLGSLWMRNGEFDKGRDHYLAALELKKQLLPEQDPDLARTYNDLGVAYEEHGLLEGAEEFHRQALAIFESGLGPSNPITGNSHFNLAEVALRRGALDVAAFHVGKARSIWEPALGVESPLLGFADVVEAEVMLEKHAYVDAAGLARRAAESLESSFSAQHPAVGRALRIEGRALMDGGELDAGLAQLERAVSVLSTYTGGQAARAKLDLALALRRSSRRDHRAVTLAREARVQLSGLGVGWRGHLREADLLLRELGVDPVGGPQETR